MSSDFRSPCSESSPPEGVTSVQEDWTQLRTLLLAPEQTQLDEIRERLDNRVVQSEDVSHVLPEAFALRGDNDQQLSTVLTPYVENGLAASVRKSPRTIVDAIAPIIGPAIRQAIARALQSMTQSFNHSLDESVSMRGLRWRVEAWRTGKPFAEVVLLHRLRYRVEQVFLIHRETGLLLQHVATDGAVIQDQHVLSGMLTAIQNYVQDSFGGRQDQTLEQFQVGEWTVWSEQGSQAYLACVVRGTPPASLRDILCDALDHIHAQHTDALTHFVGDAAPFTTTQPHLESCLQAHYDSPPKQGSLKLWILLGLLLLGSAWWGWMTYQAHARWSNLLERLRNEPGLVVTEAKSAWGGYHLEGLRDPLARDPTAMVVEAGLEPTTVKAMWSPYYALDSPLVLARAQSILQPPTTVKLHIEGETLVATGSAPADWARETKRLAVLVPGVSQYRDDGLVTTSIPVLLDQINRTIIHFRSGSSTVEPAEQAVLDAVSTTLRELDRAVLPSGQRVAVEILGSTDTTGSVARNLQLSKQRAQAVLAILGEKRLGDGTALVTGTVRLSDQREATSEAGSQRIVTLRASLTVPEQIHGTARP
ncbi:MAG: OmpA family protein [Nitrospira sp.]|nr:OmpA family protein [Nitrospira sp.]MDH4370234.1 OmpA family protein [Nitrospira sp.]MDH5348147.1 OmpA family protein [Nitrospira sp.]MDH5496317.1 OmpA family protein [Nitrospira sp.]MDH5723846.1 OmpA family protein [Nitrospira sp.]